MTNSLTATFFSIFFWVLSSSAFAQSVNIPLTDGSNTSPLVIESDEGLEWIPKEGKYIARHKHKQNPCEDIEKAIWYLERHLEILKANND